MAFLVPNIGEKTCLNAVSTMMLSATLYLYTNDITPNSTHVMSNFIVAADFMYTNPTFGVVATDGAGKAYMVMTDTTLTQNNTTSQVVYGYFIADGSGNLVCAENFTPITLEANGDQIRISNLSFRLYC